MLKSPACVSACLGPCPTSVPYSAAAHTVNTTPFLQGHFFYPQLFRPRVSPFWAPSSLCRGSKMFKSELQRCFSVLFPLRSPRRLVTSHLAPHWVERQDLGQGAFSSLISVKFSFWKGRSGKDCVCSAMVGGRHGEKPPGGLVWLLLDPTDLSGRCWCSHLLPRVPAVSPSPFSKRGDPGSPSFLQWCWSGGEVQDGAATFPLPCPRLHIPTCPQPGLLSPAAPPPSPSHGTKAGPSWGPGDPSGLVWTQAAARLSLP